MAIHRMWKQTQINRVLKGLSAEKKKFVQSWTRLRERINDLLEYYGVTGLYEAHIRNLDTVTDPEQKTRFELSFERNQKAIAHQEAIDGMYILQTSLDAKKYTSLGLAPFLVKEIDDLGYSCRKSNYPSYRAERLTWR